jgi:hypothetical protein
LRRPKNFGDAKRSPIAAASVMPSPAWSVKSASVPQAARCAPSRLEREWSDRFRVAASI